MGLPILHVTVHKKNNKILQSMFIYESFKYKYHFTQLQTQQFDFVQDNFRLSIKRRCLF
jgi:hypothetical protein